MKKKVLSLILALLMTASAASGVLAYDTAAIAEDTAVEETVVAGQYDKAIEFLNNYGIFKGKSADDLGAEDMLERYQMALFVARISTGWVDDEKWEDGPENWSEFTDISEGPVANYWGALSYANSKGIIEGYGNGKFGPTDGITYQNALTMVVRTLGYTGLEWPWGYIEKAVSLGLTDGITDVAYTQELNRGEVAQILYNALFATTKNGDTLGMRSFGVEFGWEKVVIVASDLTTFIKDNDTAAKKDGTRAYTEWNSDSIRLDDDTANGSLVGFKLLNDDGTLGDDLYYAYAKDFGLSGAENAHDDEAVVGDAYYVLFEAEDGNLVRVVGTESLLMGTLTNRGNDKDADVDGFFGDYAVVSKYTSLSYVNVTASTKPEALVFNALGDITEERITGNTIAIDWATGDIGSFVEEDGEKTFEVIWYYNELLDRYYKYDTTDDGVVVGIDWMSDKEFEETYEDLNIKENKNVKGFGQMTSAPSSSAYADLKIFDTQALADWYDYETAEYRKTPVGGIDGNPDRAIYEEYRLGYLSVVDRDGYDAIQIKKVDGFNAEDLGDVLDEDLSAYDVVVKEYEEGTSNNKDVDRVWFVEGYEPMVDEDGEYVDGYVIYNYDAESGAIKVVKNVEDGSDEDTFVATGVVRAYNAKKATVTIGDTTYEANYDTLRGTGFYKVNKNDATRAEYTAKLRDLFNQFVEYVIVDGKLVAMEAAGQTRTELIVVDSYAGLSSDGYIVVNGYSTDDLKYDRFRIGSYDNWMKGDYYYYLNDTKAAESFSKGAVYAISSYDEGEDVYYVQLVGEWDADYTWQVVDPDADYKGDYVTMTSSMVKIEESGSGYMTYSKWDDEANAWKVSYDRKTKADDKYIIITIATEQRPYASIRVYEGRLEAGWTVIGQEVGKTDDNTFLLVNVPTETLVGFQDSYKTGLVVLLDDTYDYANYNGANMDDIEEDWYLLGASEFAVTAFDLLTGSFNQARVGTNVDLTEGHVYFTQDGVLVEDLGIFNAHDFVAHVNLAYADSNTYVAGGSWEGAFGYDGTAVDGDWLGVDQPDAFNLAWADDNKDNDHLDDIEADLLVCKADEAFAHATCVVEDAEHSYAAFRGDKVDDSVKYRYVDIEDGVITGITEIANSSSKGSVRAQLEDKIEDENITTLRYAFVYDVAGHDIVFYIFPCDSEVTVINDKLSADLVVDNFQFDNDTDAQIIANLVYDQVEVTYAQGHTDAYVDKYIINGITLTFTGEATLGAHDKIAEHGLFFGLNGEHTVEGYDVSCSINGAPALEWDSIVTETYCDDCSLVQSVYVAFKTPYVLDVAYDMFGNAIVDDLDMTLVIDKAGLGHTAPAVLDIAFDLDEDAAAANPFAALVITMDTGDSTVASCADAHCQTAGTHYYDHDDVAIEIAPLSLDDTAEDVEEIISAIIGG